MKLAFIGGGVMAEAIIGGVLASNLTPPEDVSVGEPVNERREQLTQTHGLNAFADNVVCHQRRRPRHPRRQASVTARSDARPECKSESATNGRVDRGGGYNRNACQRAGARLRCSHYAKYACTDWRGHERVDGDGCGARRNAPCRRDRFCRPSAMRSMCQTKS